MKLYARLAVATVAATVIAALAQPAQAKGPDVYTTPGAQAQNGRLWDTSCAKYTSTIVRCTTNIWATQIVYKGGKYLQKTGWHFNNLTYLPSKRGAWKSNPLAANGRIGGKVEWTSSGRKWRTECDTAATGRGACRSYIWTTYISGAGARPTSKQGWVFNNIVRFAEGGAKAVTKVPANIIDQSVLTPTGLGPIQAGMRYQDLATLGYVRWLGADDAYCRAGAVTGALERRGIDLDIFDRTGTLDLIFVKGKGVRTAAGAGFGTTYRQLKAMYGSKGHLKRMENEGEPDIVYEVADGKHAMGFVLIKPGQSVDSGFYSPGESVSDSAYVGMLYAGESTGWLMKGC